MASREVGIYRPQVSGMFGSDETASGRPWLQSIVFLSLCVPPYHDRLFEKAQLQCVLEGVIVFCSRCADAPDTRMVRSMRGMLREAGSWVVMEDDILEY